jgi:hypothetical protein
MRAMQAEAHEAETMAKTAPVIAGANGQAAG